MNDVLRYLTDSTWSELLRDVVDFSIAYYILYLVLLVLRGTRAMQVVVGLLLLFVLNVGAKELELTTTETLLGTVLSSAILVIVVIFQGDIRRALMRVGSNPFEGPSDRPEESIVEEVVQAATILARQRIGATITFSQSANLEEFVGINRGIELDALVSSELLVALFVPEGLNQLHDGAVVISGKRIIRAGMFFPMPDERRLSSRFGSRHRAALGITEETDAVVIVVSEERGTMSFCFNGNLVPHLDEAGLRQALRGVFRPNRSVWQREIKRLRSWFPGKNTGNIDQSSSRIEQRSRLDNHQRDSIAPDRAYVQPLRRQRTEDEVKNAAPSSHRDLMPSGQLDIAELTEEMGSHNGLNHSLNTQEHQHSSKDTSASMTTSQEPNDHQRDRGGSGGTSA